MEEDGERRARLARLASPSEFPAARSEPSAEISSDVMGAPQRRSYRTLLGVPASSSSARSNQPGPPVWLRATWRCKLPPRRAK